MGLACFRRVDSLERGRERLFCSSGAHPIGPSPITSALKWRLTLDGSHVLGISNRQDRTPSALADSALLRRPSCHTSKRAWTH